MKKINILCIGDIVGKPGRNVLNQHLHSIKEEFNIDFCNVNVENAATGHGITQSIYDSLLDLGVDSFTGGNHIYQQRSSLKYFDQLEHLVRPINYPPHSLGEGYRIFEIEHYKVAIINGMGRVFMTPLDCPFRLIRRAVDDVSKVTPIILVDFHAEVTSEKIAMGWTLDGLVSCVFGTHTHVQTADERILPNGTAYITDIGMTGSWNSVIGMEKEAIIEKFHDQMAKRFIPSDKNPYIINGIVITVDSQTGRALNIQRVFKTYQLTSLS